MKLTNKEIKSIGYKNVDDTLEITRSFDEVEIVLKYNLEKEKEDIEKRLVKINELLNKFK